MCGISGFVDFTSKSNKSVLDKMAEIQTHRGPDDMGTDIYETDEATIGFAQNRLAIIDLSPGGHQPMHYKQLSIVFNGEIYNYQEIKKLLLTAGHRFTSESDTEVILHAYDEWGTKCVERFIGMFAFVIYDRDKEEVVLIRDRAGVKPLHYYYKDGLFMFASELKAFYTHPKFEKEIEFDSVIQYMQYSFIPSPYCIFKHCYKLNPGSILSLQIKNRKINITKYWQVTDFYKLPTLDISYDEAQNHLETLFKSAFEYRMLADVPVGVFLSGGFDSTCVAAILQNSRLTSKIKTFTIGFDSGNNEAPFAKDIAKHIGTDHNEYYCTVKESQSLIPDLPFFYDEPFADSSAIPTLMVSKMARQEVTVALSADGGDEIFAGYTYYNTYLKHMALLKKVPAPFKKSTGKMINTIAGLIPSERVSHKFKTVAHLFNTPENKLAPSLQHSYFKKITARESEQLFIKAASERKTHFDENFENFSDPLSIALANDYRFYMANDVLTKVDRATMAVSLEGREPLLDQRIVEFAAQLPSEFKLSSMEGKKILKDIVYKYVPYDLMNRPKTGFVIPVHQWLKKDLSYLLDEYLSATAIKASGVFNYKRVNELRTMFSNGLLPDEDIIWKILQFQMWFKKWGN